MNYLQDWSSISPNLYIWDYVVNFARYIMPFPNVQVLQSNIQTFRENNAIGVMEQAAYQGRGGEFSELKSYLISKLLWNPDLNVEKVINDFMSGYYGKSGHYIRQYFDLLQSRVTPETQMYIRLKADNPIFSDGFVNKSIKIFNNAKEVADSKEILRRVKRASLPLLYLKCKRSPVVARKDGTYKQFSTIIKSEGIAPIAEYGETLDSFRNFVENAE